MKKYKRVLAGLLAAALLPLQAADTMPVRAGITSSLPVYNADISKLQYVTPVENQGGDGYCWAYMADAVLESYLKKTTGNTENLSEQDMINSLRAGDNGFDKLDAGGNYRQALAYWTRGVQCGPRDYYVTGVADLGACGDRQTYLTDIKALVKDYGAVGVSVDFPAASRGNWTNNGAYYKSGSNAVNHGVTIVGWDDSYPKENFKAGSQPEQGGAFLVKNSWGADDAYSIPKDGGYTGYYWMSYENYFQDAFAVTGVTSRAGLYDVMYEHDPRGLAGYTGETAPGGSQVYEGRPYGKTDGSRYLTSVSTYVQKGCIYEMSVKSAGNTTQLLLKDAANPVSSSGFHLFNLAVPVSVQDDFYISIKVTNKSEKNVAVVPQAADSAGNAQADVYCVKAYTKEASSFRPQKPVVQATCAGRQISDGDWVNGEVTFQLSGSGDGAGYEYRLPGQSEWTKCTDSTFTCKPPTDGAQSTVEVRAYHTLAQGAVSDVASFRVQLDAAAPTIGDAVSTLRPGVSGAFLHVSGIADKGSGVSGYCVSEGTQPPTDAAAWTAFTGDSFDYACGKNTTYAVWVRDRAGNVSACRSVEVAGAMTVEGVTVQAADGQAARGSIVKMAAQVTGTNNPTQGVTWSVSGAGDADTSINARGELTIGLKEYAQSLTVKAVSTLDKTKSATCTVIPTAQQGQIMLVAVNPVHSTVQTGGSQTFQASVYGTNSPAPLVDWRISGNRSSSTYISDGTLYVAAGELSESIMVYATSKMDPTKSAMATVRIGRAYTITASANTGGTISPWGSNSIVQNGSAEYTVSPYSGYKLRALQVDGTDVLSSAVRHGDSSWEYYTYRFTNVTQTHTITAVFAVDKTYTVTFKSDGVVYLTQRVSHGEAASAPYISKSGYVLGWDKSFQNVTSDLTVNAVWTKNSGSSPNGSASDSDADVPYQGAAAMVETVEKSIYTLRRTGTATYMKNTTAGKRRTGMVVPNTVYAAGRDYRVTSIGSRSFLRNIRLRTVTVGKNVKVIGSAAFYGCKNLRRVTIKSKQVYAVGARAFQGISKNATIYVPRSCLEDYRILIRNSGNTTARIKAYDAK